jgi:adenylylsulfate kinase
VIGFQETKRRSLGKAISLRLLIVIVDIFIIYSLTHRFDVTLSVIVFTNLIGTLIHFLHERIWNRIHWGKNTNRRLEKEILTGL